MPPKKPAARKPSATKPKAAARGSEPPPVEPDAGLYDRGFAGADAKYPPPTFLAPAAKSKWVELVPALLARTDSSGNVLLDQVTRDSLAVFCDAWGEFEEACRALAGLDSPFIEVGNGGALQPHPAVAMKKAARAELRNSGKALGLNPVARSGLRVKEAGAVDKVSAILSGGK